MYKDLLRTYIFGLLFCFGISILSAQERDSLPPEQEIDSIVIDTTIVDTVVIRRTLKKIKFVPRSVDLMNPVISFNKTKALNEKPNRIVLSVVPSNEKKIR